MEKPADLDRGWDLIFGGRFHDAIIPLTHAAADYRWAAEALYGIGVARLSLNDDVSAEAALWDSLQREPHNADAVFYLGLIAERRGGRQEAAGHYREALALAPDHEPAKARLAVLRQGGGVRPSVVPLPAAAPPPPPLLARPAPAAHPAEPLEEVERLLESVHVSVRPRPVAYLASFDREVLAPLPVHPATAAVLLGFWAALFLPRRSLPFLDSFITLAQVAVGVAAVLQLLGLALTALRAATTRVTVLRGRLRLEGDPLRPDVSVDLAEVESLDLRRTGLQPLTGDGTLAFTTAHGTLLVPGVARGEHLLRLYRQLLELLEVLRTR